MSINETRGHVTWHYIAIHELCELRFKNFKRLYAIYRKKALFKPENRTFLPEIGYVQEKIKCSEFRETWNHLIFSIFDFFRFF